MSETQDISQISDYWECPHNAYDVAFDGDHQYGCDAAEDAPHCLNCPNRDRFDPFSPKPASEAPR